VGAEALKISGLTTCVDFADHLGQGIERWKRGLDDLVVVTSLKDHATSALCDRWNVRTHATDAFYHHGAAFNKAGAMDEALYRLNDAEWVLFFDADVNPSDDWRQVVDAARPKLGNLYGAHRTNEHGYQILDTELAGFFQLWHVMDHVTQDRPLLGSWHNASAYDSEFMRRWPRDRRLILPLTVTHTGRPGVNWCGRGNRDGMENMRAERRKHGGYQHERMNHGQ
jgi:hypothetical protein